MTTATKTPLAPLLISPDIVEEVQGRAHLVDRGDVAARYILEILAAQGYFDSPDRTHRARLIRDLSRSDLSVGFTTWAHLMTATYLESAGTEYARRKALELRTGLYPGVTGMAAAFKELVGAGSIELHARREPGGLRINGKLGWASNLYEDALLVTAVVTDEGERFIVAIESGTDGMAFGQPLSLLGLNATASSFVTFDEVFIPEEQILSSDFDAFMTAVRPTFVLLQIAECIGVAEAALFAARDRLFGVNEALGEGVDKASERLTDIIARHDRALTDGAGVAELLQLRLDAADIAGTAANLEVRVAGGAGYARNSPASRRFREAAFIPVQSPSEAQLRWELERERGHHG